MGIPFMPAIPNVGRLTFFEAPKHFKFSCEICLIKAGRAGVQFGLDQNGGGYAFSLDGGTHSVNFMQVNGGGGESATLSDLGLKRFDFDLDTWYPVSVEYDGAILRVWFNNNPLDTDPWPKYEFPLSLQGLRVATDAGCDVAQFRSVSVEKLDRPPQPAGETFANPVMVGADPEILLYNGTYYLYNRVPNDPNRSEDAYLKEDDGRAMLDQAGDINAIFRCASSDDLIHWSAYTPVFFRTPALEGAFCMSPNVLHKNGYFYLFFAAANGALGPGMHLYYAVASSPQGPFGLTTTKPLHSDILEIGGMPFMDDDGEVYISYVRFDQGNHIWLQHIAVADGVVTPDDPTTVHLISPDEEYEKDKHNVAEGAVFVKHKGLYYMIYACGDYRGHYGEAYAVSDSIYGPYVKYPFNPILHHNFQVNGPGDGVIVYSKDRTRINMAYHCHVSLQNIEPRMTCLDRMKFVPDPKGGPDILTVYGPTTTPQPMPFSGC